MFSSSSQYAIRSILYLSTKGKNERATVDEMSKALKIPKAYLSKILQQLSKSDIINSSKGRGGGFYLTKKNMKRPLVDVVICMEGENVLDNCVLGLTICSNENPCRLHHHFTNLKKDMQRVMVEESVKSLAKQQPIP